MPLKASAVPFHLCSTYEREQNIFLQALLATLNRSIILAGRQREIWFPRPLPYPSLPTVFKILIKFCIHILLPLANFEDYRRSVETKNTRFYYIPGSHGEEQEPVPRQSKRRLPPVLFPLMLILFQNWSTKPSPAGAVKEGCQFSNQSLYLAL